MYQLKAHGISNSMALKLPALRLKKKGGGGGGGSYSDWKCDRFFRVFCDLDV